MGNACTGDTRKQVDSPISPPPPLERRDAQEDVDAERQTTYSITWARRRYDVWKASVQNRTRRRQRPRVHERSPRENEK